ncbi:hypothetical protein EWM64_g1291 [Hericium alpestre]|uniref:Uncharacterized protein n=1 Tax=Hericium alpestre TaxID=135208 RepID=A0A4Z0A8X4_9AGAM|nr:hypothetical protein EWM64_g1291 [Hericium alpestre]
MRAKKKEVKEKQRVKQQQLELSIAQGTEADSLVPDPDLSSTINARPVCL